MEKFVSIKKLKGEYIEDLDSGIMYSKCFRIKINNSSEKVCCTSDVSDPTRLTPFEKQRKCITSTSYIY